MFKRRIYIDYNLKNDCFVNEAAKDADDLLKLFHEERAVLKQQVGDGIC